MNLREVSYFYVTVDDRPENAYDLLASLATAEINLLAFSAVPYGPHHAQLTIFPEDPETLTDAARTLGLPLIGPQHAILVQGDDQLGALAEVHRRLVREGVEIYASSGVTDGRGGFGYVIYVREDQHRIAAHVLRAET